MSNIKHVSQKTGQFISADSEEAGFLVNMEDADGAAFLKRYRGAGFVEVKVAKAEPVPVIVDEPQEKALTPSEKRRITMATKKAAQTSK